MRQKIVEKFDDITHKYFYSKIGNIGPGTIKEAHQIHRGIWRGTVKVWTPYGLYKEMKRLADSFGNEWEENEKHYYIGFFVPFFTMKWTAIWLAVNVGQNSAVRQVAIACAGI